MQHIIEHLGGSYKKPHLHYKYFSATKLGSYFDPKISGQVVNLWLEKNNYIKKSADSQWVVTQKGKPYFYDQGLRPLEVGGVIYWNRKILEVIEYSHSELPKEPVETDVSKKKEGNPHIKRIMDSL